jgi:hypothetical protein
MQGRIDLKFRVQGSKREQTMLREGTLTVTEFGTVMFTAIRPEQSSPWRIGEHRRSLCGGVDRDQWSTLELRC